MRKFAEHTRTCGASGGHESAERIPLHPFTHLLKGAFSPPFLMSIPYQKKYDRAVIQELVEWFRARFDRLPQRIQLRPGVVIPDVKVMVRNYFDVVQMHYENPTYGAQVHHLFEVRDCLWAQGFE